MCRALINAAEFHQRELQRRSAKCRVAFITLTYRPGARWHGRHISEAVKHMRHFCERRGHRLAYEWKAELQKRGAVHYHMILWLPLFLAVKGYQFDSRGWWPHGLTQHVWARNPVGYVAKYVSKADGGRFPKGIRMHGRGGMSAEVRKEVRYALLPKYVREEFPPESDVVRARGGGWVNRLDGKWIPGAILIVDWSR